MLSGFVSCMHGSIDRVWVCLFIWVMLLSSTCVRSLDWKWAVPMYNTAINSYDLKEPGFSMTSMMVHNEV